MQAVESDYFWLNVLGDLSCVWHVSVVKLPVLAILWIQVDFSHSLACWTTSASTRLISQMDSHCPLPLSLPLRQHT